MQRIKRSLAASPRGQTSREQVHLRLRIESDHPEQKPYVRPPRHIAQGEHHASLRVFFVVNARKAFQSTLLAVFSSPLPEGRARLPILARPMVRAVAVLIGEPEIVRDRLKSAEITLIEQTRLRYGTRVP